MRTSDIILVIILFFVACTLVKESNEDVYDCDRAGGVLSRGVCIKKESIIKNRE
jgi:hypothetical protein